MVSLLAKQNLATECNCGQYAASLAGELMDAYHKIQEPVGHLAARQCLINASELLQNYIGYGTGACEGIDHNDKQSLLTRLTDIFNWIDMYRRRGTHPSDFDLRNADIAPKILDIKRDLIKTLRHCAGGIE